MVKNYQKEELFCELFKAKTFEYLSTKQVKLELIFAFINKIVSTFILWTGVDSSEEQTSHLKTWIWMLLSMIYWIK